jgi:hypothetical protein
VKKVIKVTKGLVVKQDQKVLQALQALLEMVVLLDHPEQEEIQVPEELKDQPEQKDPKVLLVLLVQQEQKVQLGVLEQKVL